MTKDTQNLLIYGAIGLGLYWLLTGGASASGGASGPAGLLTGPAKVPPGGVNANSGGQNFGVRCTGGGWCC
jgi:hypothetical protein